MLQFQETIRLLEKKKKRQIKRSFWLSHSLQTSSHGRVPGRRRSLQSPITALQKLLLQPPIRR